MLAQIHALEEQTSAAARHAAAATSTAVATPTLTGAEGVNRAYSKLVKRPTTHVRLNVLGF